MYSERITPSASTRTSQTPHVLSSIYPVPKSLWDRNVWAITLSASVPFTSALLTSPRTPLTITHKSAATPQSLIPSQLCLCKHSTSITAILFPSYVRKITCHHVFLPKKYSISNKRVAARAYSSLKPITLRLQQAPQMVSGNSAEDY